MPRNPYLNALVGALYISVIVLAINWFSQIIVEETLLIPIIMLSLLVLSVSLMGYLFIYEPLALLLANKKREAKVFFGKTLLTFAIFVIVLLLVVLL